MDRPGAASGANISGVPCSQRGTPLEFRYLV
jgi:hypothetical protein